MYEPLPDRHFLPPTMAWSLILAGALFGRAPSDTGTEIGKILAKFKCPSSGISVAFADLSHDSVAFGLNADTAFVPASVSKLVTGAVALELLGPGHVFKTGIYRESGRTEDDGTIDGNLYVKGGGDPGLFAERMWLLTEHLFHLGVRSVAGDLVLDDSYFDTVTQGPGYGEDATSRAYQAEVGALSASFNCVGAHVRPGKSEGAQACVDLLPPLKGVRITNKARTVAAGKGGTLEVVTEPDGRGTRVTVSGAVGVDEKPRYVYRRVWGPSTNFAAALEAFMEQRGMKVKGKVRMGALPDSLAARGPMYEFESQPLLEFVRHMFKFSSNFAAEMVFKSLSAVKDSGRGSWDASGRIVQAWWKERGLPGAPQIRNGSGMGSINRISASQLVALLRYVWGRKDYCPDYLSALSVAGVDGTLESRFGDSPLKGVVRAKTGTLNDTGVSTLAGYVLCPDRTLVFAILVNTREISQYTAWTVQEKVLEMLVDKMGGLRR